MSLDWEWPEAWDRDFVTGVASSLEASINRALASAGVDSQLRGTAVVEELDFGVVPPQLRIARIVECTPETTTFEVSVAYNGDASISLRGLQINFDPMAGVNAFARENFMPFSLRLHSIRIEGDFHVTLQQKVAPTHAPAMSAMTIVLPNGTTVPAPTAATTTTASGPNSSSPPPPSAQQPSSGATHGRSHRVPPEPPSPPPHGVAAPAASIDARATATRPRGPVVEVQRLPLHLAMSDGIAAGNKRSPSPEQEHGGDASPVSVAASSGAGGLPTGDVTGATTATARSFYAPGAGAIVRHHRRPVAAAGAAARPGSFATAAASQSSTAAGAYHHHHPPGEPLRPTFVRTATKRTPVTGRSLQVVCLWGDPLKGFEVESNFDPAAAPVRQFVKAKLKSLLEPVVTRLLNPPGIVAQLPV